MPATLRRDQEPSVQRGSSTRRMRPLILVVDDSPDLRQTVSRLLTPADYAVVEAPEGRTGLQLLRRAPAPVVALVDLVMPGLDGEGVLRAVADDPFLAARHAYVLVTEGDRFLGAELIGLLRRLGVGVLWKPFTPTALLDTVAHAGLRLAPGSREEG
jgi:CheY-like chemotaxis protein